MKRVPLILAVIIALSVSSAIAQLEDESQSDPFKERLGLRAGFAWTGNDLEKNFGGGLNLSLHFVQRIKKPFSVDVTLGAIYLGSTDSDITREFFGTEFDDVSMRVLIISAAPMIEFPINDRMDFFFSAGVGIYAVSLILDQSLNQFDLTNNHFGINLNAGASYRISTNWFVDAGVYVHKFWTADAFDIDNPDWVYIYSEGDSDPLFWNITAGIALRLF
jgi:opacity protein-like surface antigen